MKGRIKPGTLIFHDMRSWRWPNCSGGPGDPDTMFEMQETHGHVWCTAPGYGILDGKNYGCGAISIVGGASKKGSV